MRGVWLSRQWSGELICMQIGEKTVESVELSEEVLYIEESAEVRLVRNSLPEKRTECNAFPFMPKKLAFWLKL